MTKFTDWLKNDAVDCGLCDPPMEPQLAINFLKDYLLGENWYVETSESTKQINTVIVFKILMEHSREFRKEWKNYMKSNKNGE